MLVLFLSSFLFTTSIFILLHCIILMHGEQIIFMSLFLLFSGVFSMLSVAVKEWNSVVLDFHFFPLKSIIKSFLSVQFAWLLCNILLCGKEIM